MFARLSCSIFGSCWWLKSQGLILQIGLKALSLFSPFIEASKSEWSHPEVEVLSLQLLSAIFTLLSVHLGQFIEAQKGTNRRSKYPVSVSVCYPRPSHSTPKEWPLSRQLPFKTLNGGLFTLSTQLITLIYPFKLKRWSVSSHFNGVKKQYPCKLFFK